MDLAPVVASLAKECGLACRLRMERCEDDDLKTLPGTPPGKSSSTWMVLAKNDEVLVDGHRYTVFLISEDLAQSTLRIMNDEVIPDSGMSRPRASRFSSARSPAANSKILGASSSFFGVSLLAWEARRPTSEPPTARIPTMARAGFR